MNEIILQLEAQIDHLKKIQQKLILDEQAKKQQKLDGKINDLKAFGQQLNEKRKALNIDLYTLELQTGISRSTLKRIFQDPSQVRFTTVLSVAETLGISLCTL